jgi:hypothetical protein
LNSQLDEKTKETETLGSQLKEKCKEVDELATKLADEQDENASLKKKHAANIKDLTKQLQLLQKKSVSLSSSSNTTTTTTTVPQHQQLQQTPSLNSSMVSSVSEFSFTKPSVPSSNQNQRMSRTSSTSSLTDNNNKDHFSAKDTGSANNRTYSTMYDDDLRSLDSAASFSPAVRYSNEVVVGAHQATTDDVYVVDIDKQKLIEKIVKLQRDMAKKNEKIDFLQDHVNQLTGDLKRKTK